MVQCNQIEGKPCKCQLDEPRIVYLIQTVIRNTIKLLFGTINSQERDELRTAVRMPNAKAYLEFCLEDLDVHRNMISELLYTEIYRGN